MTQQAPEPTQQAPEPTQQAPEPQTLSNDAIITATDDAGNANADIGNSALAAYEKLVEQQNAQIASLQNQISVMLQSGAAIIDSAKPEPQQVNDFGNLTQAQRDYKASEGYVSLADLGKEIGAKRYENKNMEK